MSSNTPQFDTIEDSIEAFRDGNFVIVLDSTSRENEGDLIIAASAMTPEKMAFMVRHTSGIVCTPIMPDLAKALELPLMVGEKESEDPNQTAYTISIDAKHPSITTGISAHDRALACNLLVSAEASLTPKPFHFRRPGHIFPLIARPGLIRQRRGHTEAAIELCRLASLPLVGVISEIVDDGIETKGKAERKEPGMMRRAECIEFGKQWGLKCCCIEDLVAFVEAEEAEIESVVDPISCHTPSVTKNT
ncbi:BgTH12-01313 [Blumeria graminis f. sp. triticale]|uniref:3,4-dihydroxy-2-butanone 4-phosphate synthase n=3 Tax=Blumeria graminis TaxID=34373 RepID=A0A061HLT8_BLUGR|nr:34-dihydroxy-2-butanone-4-phosphate synthase (DHBP synthase) [Blumeria graminis f. sp. tritici 96224]CAD6505826.1 BgTH12-01313 [Blumeria graminis f. sp. triticale]VDB94000.1 Bgt-904 [Blumeria graminis f. sp. tritici]